MLMHEDYIDLDTALENTRAVDAAAVAGAAQKYLTLPAQEILAIAKS